MPLVTSKGMLLDALEKGYAVGAFNANNLEMAQGIIQGAEEEEAPVIVQISQGGAEFAGLEEMASIVTLLANRASVPVVLHLDHGVDYAFSMKCLRAGFTSLMYDGSLHSFEKNVAVTKDVVRAGHLVGIPVEAELGQVPKDPDSCSFEELKAFMTNPEEAVSFVEKTGVDSLAISVGSMHKMKTRSATLDIERIKKIREVVDLPLVLHGSSGVTHESVQEAIEAGITKINVYTHIAKIFTMKVREILTENQGMADIRKYLAPAREEMKKEVIDKIRLFKSQGRAKGIKEVEVTPTKEETQDIIE